MNTRISDAVAWHTEDHATDKSATTYDRATAERWIAKGWPVHAMCYAEPKPAKPEAVRLRDELRERADEDQLLDELRDVEDYFNDVDPNPIHLATVQAAITALASVQPSPAGQGDALSVRTAYAIATSWREQASKLKVGRATLIRCAAELEAALAARQPVGNE